MGEVRAGICLECLEYVTSKEAILIHMDAPNDFQFTDTTGRHRILSSGRGINTKAAFAFKGKNTDEQNQDDGTTATAE